jgi:Protein of unknown function (DUF3168)
MKDIIESIRRVLRKDPLIYSLVGADADEEIKVYQAVAKQDSVAPYVVMAPAPGAAPISVYGEMYAVETFTLQLTAWGRNSKEAWQLADAIQDAVAISDYDAGMWVFMKGKRITFPQELPDRDTALVQVPVIYEFQFGKEAQI